MKQTDLKTVLPTIVIFILPSFFIIIILIVSFRACPVPGERLGAEDPLRSPHMLPANGGASALLYCTGGFLRTFMCFPLSTSLSTPISYWTRAGVM